jgi:pyruvate,water dikinase
MSAGWIVWLDQADAPNLQRLGGKAYHLARMRQAGFPVPRGFCLTTEAYDAFAAGTGAGVLSEPARNRECLQRGEYPDVLRHAILEAWLRLEGVPVAMRSSATAEDSAEASFAGQQSTFLNVRNERSLFEAIRSCWASLWSESAVAYRERRNAPGKGGHPSNETFNGPGGPKMAAIVQIMVPADAAGVAFSLDPITGANSALG